MPNDSPLPIASASPTGRRLIRIGSRRSALALRQSHMVRDALNALGHPTEIVTFSTVGDERLDVPLPQIGGKGVFTAELERALLGGDVDVCVHSLKDLPTESPAGLAIGAVLPREDPRDALLIRDDLLPTSRTLDALPRGARVGTSSLRRGAIVRHRRPDLQLVDLRGNVPTRIQKLDDGQMEAIILAGAGLLRLGLGDRITEWLDAPAWLPAPAQGVIAMQVRADDGEILGVLAQVHDEGAWRAAVAERAFLHALEGGCQVPVGALAIPEGGRLRLHGVILDVDGGAASRGDVYVDAGDADVAEAAGASLAQTLLDGGGGALLARARETATAPRT